MNKNWNSYKKSFISHNISMLNLSLNELKLVAKRRSIKDYKSMSKVRLLVALDKSESAKSGNNFDNAKKD